MLANPDPMNSFIQFVGPNQSLQLFGIRLLGLNALTTHKLLFTACFFIFLGVKPWKFHEIN